MTVFVKKHFLVLEQFLKIKLVFASMILLAEDISFGLDLVADKEIGHMPLSIPTSLPEPLLANIFHDSRPVGLRLNGPPFWQYGLAVRTAASSQYDTIVELCKQNISLPDALFCLAGSGRQFHGQRNRFWASPPGNLYLTVHFAPNAVIPDFGTGFSLLTAVSIVETIDRLAGLEGRAGIKWVNDILVDGAKVSGYLTYTQSMQGMVTAAVIGIGLNVNTVPDIPPDPFVPRVTAIGRYSNLPSERILPFVLQQLLARLEDNYELLKKGGYRRLLDEYRRRSLIIEKEVTIVTDPPTGGSQPVASGTVRAIGDHMELYLHGMDKPISTGRLILKS